MLLWLSVWFYVTCRNRSGPKVIKLFWVQTSAAQTRTREFLNFDELKKIIFLVLHIKITNTLSNIDKKKMINDQKLILKIHILQTISIKFWSFNDFSFKSDNCKFKCYLILWCLYCFYCRIQPWLLSSS